jgi:hypothetical protein
LVEVAGSRQPAADLGTDQNNLLLVVDVDEEVTEVREIQPLTPLPSPPPFTLHARRVCGN